MITAEMCESYAHHLDRLASGPVADLGVGWDPTPMQITLRRWKYEAAARHVREVVALRIARGAKPRRIYRDVWARGVEYHAYHAMGLDPAR
jgi:hypothetical protein